MKAGWLSDREIKDGIDVPYKGMTLKLCGFNKVVDPKTKKLKFAWKFKHEDKLVLIYNPDGIKAGEIIEGLKSFGFQVQDVMTEVLPNIYNSLSKDEIKRLEKKNGKKKSS
jgi:hypothetical protein